MRAGLSITVVAIAATLWALAPWPRRPEGARTITFTVWGAPFEDALFADVYARGFERLTPEVRVDYQRHDGNQLGLKYTSWHARGRGAEVMRVQVTDYHQMVARGMLQPLDEHLARGGVDLAEIPPELLAALRVDGRLYALPQDTAVFGLYYNIEHFEAYDAAHPGQPLPRPSADWTWEDLRRAAIALTERDDSGRVARQGLDLPLWQWPFMALFAQAGGEQWSPDGLTTRIASDAGVEALQFLHDLAFRDRVWVPYFGGIDQGASPDAKFVAGRTSLYLDGSWRVPNFEDRAPNLRFAVSPTPRGPRVGSAPVVLTGSCLWAISSRARHKDDAWRMLAWLVSRDQAIRYWDALRVAPPANLAAMRSPAFRSTSGIADPDRPGRFIVPSMDEARYEERAAWLLHAFTPDPATGWAPAYLPTSLYQRALEDHIKVMLEAYLATGAEGRDRAREFLHRAARGVHAVIDRDRAAKGLAPVSRGP